MQVGIVMPYYQTEPGLLRAALDGVWAQKLPADVTLRVVVVDDGSPHPAREELSGLQAPAPHTLTIIGQENAGPGAARNAALDLLGPEIDYVALLDSDDVWRAGHLADALRRLDAGADFYFCNHIRPDWHEASAFERNALLQTWLTDPEDTPIARLEGDDDAFLVRPERAVEGFINAYLAQTSTVVYRRSTLGAVRFEPRLRNASEDHLFWIEAAGQAKRIVFSLHSNVVCGTGVNLYYSSFDWRSPEAPRRFACLMLFYTILEQRLRLPPPERELVRRRRHTYGQAFVFLWANLAMKTRQWDWKTWRTLLGATPLMAPRLAGAMVTVIVARLIDPSGFYDNWK